MCDSKPLRTCAAATRRGRAAAVPTCLDAAQIIPRHCQTRGAWCKTSLAAYAIFRYAARSGTRCHRMTLRAGLFQALERLGPRRRVLVVPPDFTRVHSQRDADEFTMNFRTG